MQRVHGGPMHGEKQTAFIRGRTERRISNQQAVFVNNTVLYDGKERAMFHKFFWFDRPQKALSDEFRCHLLLSCS